MITVSCEKSKIVGGPGWSFTVFTRVSNESGKAIELSGNSAKYGVLNNEGHACEFHKPEQAPDMMLLEPGADHTVEYQFVTRIEHPAGISSTILGKTATLAL